MTNSVNGVKMPINPGAGFTVDTGTVLGIDGNTATVSMSKGIQKVALNYSRGKGGTPAVGETWFLDRMYGDWLFAVLKSPAVPAWQPPALLGAWTSVGSGGWAPGSAATPAVGYYRDALGWVQLRGSAAGGTASTSHATGPLAADVFQLPAGYRPGDDGILYFTVGAAVVGVYPDGWVRLQSGSAPVPLATVRFLAEQ